MKEQTHQKDMTIQKKKERTQINNRDKKEN